MIMRSMFTSLASGVWLATALMGAFGCDEDRISFRDGTETESWIVVHWGEPPTVITTKMFSSIVTTCSNVHKPKWTMTVSGRQPDLAKPMIVLGLGGAAYVPISFWECLKNEFIVNDAVPGDDLNPDP
jgi:hypothetical protein